MADTNNPGQFGNRDDTMEQASKGGQARQESGGQFKKAAHRTKMAGKKGGHSSHGNNQ